uniref:Cyclin-dependent protein kinase inhibitor SMR6 n=1 Tax=Rhizophora mucronata TaxID=61149 RepID=A0A2P2IWJ2_RHIMU
MGISEKPQVDGGLEFDGKKWVIAGISLRAPLKPIYTNPVEKDSESEECSTTPTGEEARIPAISTCPPAPRKRKATLKCNYSGVKEFFTPPDLETVFIRHVERAN